jgi:hypothetical protein
MSVIDVMSTTRATLEAGECIIRKMMYMPAAGARRTRLPETSQEAGPSET